MIQNNQYLTFDDVLIKPKWSSIKSRMDVNTSGHFSRNIRLKLPISSANMRTVTDANTCSAMSANGGIGILHRYFEDDEKWINEIRKITHNAKYGISIGYEKWNDILLKIFDEMSYNLPDVVVYDVANAANQNVYLDVKDLIDFKIRGLQNKWDFDIVIGNIATAEAASKYKELNIDGIKCGIGPSSVCSTRLMTGCGVPQLSAIMEISNVLKRSEIKLIADGGITKPADFVKALAAGADCIMMGTEISHSQESPGWEWNQDKQLYEKSFRGEASFSKNRTHEGIEKTLESKNPKTISEIISEYEGGLRSAMSYCNANTIEHLQENAEFIHVTSNTLIENRTR